MMKNLQKILFSLCLLIGILAPAGIARADVLDPVCVNNPTATACQGRNQTVDNNSIFGPNGILTKVARLLAIVVGLASVIMIIIGGFQYVMSSGDSANITNAKNTILYAIIGLLVALLAQGIISFVLVRL